VFCRNSKVFTSADKDNDYCKRFRFRLVTANAEEGSDAYQDLSKKSNLDLGRADLEDRYKRINKGDHTSCRPEKREACPTTRASFQQGGDNGRVVVFGRSIFSETLKDAGVMDLVRAIAGAELEEAGTLNIDWTAAQLGAQAGYSTGDTAVLRGKVLFRYGRLGAGGVRASFRVSFKTAERPDAIVFRHRRVQFSHDQSAALARLLQISFAPFIAED
jgi:hypothetical protein